MTTVKPWCLLILELLLCKICLQFISFVLTLSNSCLEFIFQMVVKYLLLWNLLKSRMEACYSELVLSNTREKEIPINELGLYEPKDQIMTNWPKYEQFSYSKVENWMYVYSQDCFVYQSKGVVHKVRWQFLPNKRWHFWTTYQHLLVNVVCEWPLLHNKYSVTWQMEIIKVF